VKCIFKGCEHVGDPEPGFSFYACPDCLDRLAEEIDNAWNDHQTTLEAQKLSL